MQNSKSKLNIAVFLGAALLLLGIFAFFRFGGAGTEILWNLSNGGVWLLPLVGVAALIDSINPCAFSILLLTIAFLFSIGKLRSKILSLGAVYILGIFIAYMLISLGLLQALHIFAVPHFMAKVGAVLLVALGLINIVNNFFPAFPIKLRIPHAAHRMMAKLMDKSSLPAVFILGGLVGLCEFPCTGGPYLMVLGLLHDQTTYIKGLGYLILYNTIFVLPLAIILGIASNSALLEKVKNWQRKEDRVMRYGSGIAMVLLGVIIFFL